jgi:hypothetical protein
MREGEVRSDRLAFFPPLQRDTARFLWARRSNADTQKTVPLFHSTGQSATA